MAAITPYSENHSSYLKREEPKEEPFSFSKIKADSIQHFDKEKIKNLYDEGVRLEKHEKDLQKDLNSRSICEEEIKKARKTLETKKRDSDFTSREINKNYHKAQKFKFLFGWTLGLSIAIMLGLAGWAAYATHKRRQSEKQLREVLAQETALQSKGPGND